MKLNQRFAARYAVGHLFFLASLTATAAPTLNNDCIGKAKNQLKITGFSSKNKVMTDQEYAVLCTDNDAQTAVACALDLKQTRNNDMFPVGVAEVCGGGVSGKSAATCLSQNESFFAQLETRKLVEDGWVATVDACSGIARRLAACGDLTAESGVACKPEAASGTGAKASTKKQEHR